MPRKKIKLENIRIQSFVTNLESEDKERVKGGRPILSRILETCEGDTCGFACTAALCTDTAC